MVDVSALGFDLDRARRLPSTSSSPRRFRFWRSGRDARRGRHRRRRRARAVATARCARDGGEKLGVHAHHLARVRQSVTARGGARISRTLASALLYGHRLQTVEPRVSRPQLRVGDAHARLNVVRVVREAGDAAARRPRLAKPGQPQHPSRERGFAPRCSSTTCAPPLRQVAGHSAAAADPSSDAGGASSTGDMSRRHLAHTRAEPGGRAARRSSICFTLPHVEAHPDVDVLTTQAPRARVSAAAARPCPRSCPAPPRSFPRPAFIRFQAPSGRRSCASPAGCRAPHQLPVVVQAARPGHALKRLERRARRWFRVSSAVHRLVIHPDLVQHRHHTGR